MPPIKNLHLRDNLADPATDATCRTFFQKKKN